MAKIKRLNVRNLVPLVHFLFSFFYDRWVFDYSLSDAVITAQPMNEIVSLKTEKVFGFICVKLFGFLFILFLWRIIWYVWENRKKGYIIFLSLLAFLVAAISLLIYPFIIDSVWDANVTYSYAICFLPEYWHSAYTSLVYGGMLTVFPSPAILSPLQTVLGFGAIGYLYDRIEKSPVLKGKGRFLTIIFCLLPCSFTLFTDMYRTQQYSILVIFFLSLVVMDIIDHRKRKNIEVVLILILAGFVSVWRTEGIILAGISIFAVIVSTYGDGLKNKALLFFTYLVITLVIMLPQKIGDMKYYGKDYQFINSFPTVYNILNDSNHNMSYYGVEEDLEGLDKLVPLNLLKAYGMDGYRRYNYANGRADINQSMAGSDVQDEYLSAYKSLVIHNVPIFLKTQGTMFLASLGYLEEPYTAEYTETEVSDYPKWYFVGWDNGRRDILNRKYTNLWNINIVRQKMLRAFLTVREFIEKGLNTILFTPIILTALLLCLLGMFIYGIILFLKRKKYSLMLLTFSILAQLLGIFLVMPDDNIYYLYPSICGIVVLLVAFLGMILKGKDDCKELGT